MRILAVNDDGIKEKGLQVLIDVLGKRHEVWVIAPDKNRSGVSHGFTMTSPLCLHKVAQQRYTCSGLPVDCTIEGCKGALGFIPDIVVSGINRGANIGTDILYSGTVAGARQGAIYGLPSIAVSLESKINEWNFKPLAQFVLDNLENLVLLCEKNIFLNINALDLQENETYKGVKMTIPSIRDYRDVLEFYTAPAGDTYSFFKGGNIVTEPGESTDFAAVENRCISISRVNAQPQAIKGVAVPAFTLRG
jgi:5'-nucleotidase